jgi:hypothetical protein
MATANAGVNSSKPVAMTLRAADSIGDAEISGEKLS